MCGLLVVSLLSFLEGLLSSQEMIILIKSRELLRFLELPQMMICRSLVMILLASTSVNCQSATSRISRRSSQKLIQMPTVYCKRCLSSTQRSDTLSRIALNIHTLRSCLLTLDFLITNVQSHLTGHGTTSSQPRISFRRWSGMNPYSK